MPEHIVKLVEYYIHQFNIFQQDYRAQGGTKYISIKTYIREHVSEEVWQEIKKPLSEYTIRKRFAEGAKLSRRSLLYLQGVDIYTPPLREVYTKTSTDVQIEILLQAYLQNRAVK